MNIDEAITYSAKALGRCLSQQECDRQKNISPKILKNR